MIYQKKLQNMIKRLQDLGIQDKDVLKAMASVPRHLFISQAFEFQAYDEKALPIGHGQTISHPYTVSRMTELLHVKKGDKVLEIGTGSGYQAAVLCAMGIQLFSIEIVKSLAEKAHRVLRELDYNPALRTGDGRKGWQAYAPYKGIIVTAGASVLPKKLLEQLDVGGRMLIPIGREGENQQLTLYINGEQGIEETILEKFKFVPLV
jgi:protein-L-isoaspartate(D-aspartate) O-methyltransferase